MADLPRRLQYASASSTRLAFSSAPLKRPDEAVTQNAPSRAGMTNDLDPHPASATATRQTAKREGTVRSPFMDVVPPVRTVGPDGQADGDRGLHGLNLQERKVHPIGPLAIRGGPCRGHDASDRPWQALPGTPARVRAGAPAGRTRACTQAHRGGGAESVVTESADRGNRVQPCERCCHSSASW